MAHTKDKKTNIMHVCIEVSEEFDISVLVDKWLADETTFQQTNNFVEETADEIMAEFL